MPIYLPGFPLVRLTVPHWYGFTQGIRTLNAGPLSEDEWVRLREHDQAFGFGDSRETWIAAALSNPRVSTRAGAVCGLLRAWGAHRLVSAGSGTGSFEFLVKSSMPELTIRCGDIGDATLLMLRQRLTEAESVERMDLRHPEWVKDPNDVVLLNRVDMELSDLEWRSFFHVLADRRVRRVIWIPCGLLTAATVVTELRGVLSGFVRRRRLFRSGFLRTEARMVELFSRWYSRLETIDQGDLPTWGLHLSQ